MIRHAMNLEHITAKVCDLSREVGALIVDQARKIVAGDIQEKGNHNFVTYVDRMAEDRLVEQLHRIVPEAGFLAEEGHTSDGSSAFRWVIDPLDGTTNFIHRIPFFSVSIALMEGHKVIAGVVYEINRKECFYSWAGAPAYLNGERIRVSQGGSLRDSLLVTGFPYDEAGKLKEYLDIFSDFTLQSRGLRRLGSAAADLAYVACGRFEGFYEYGLNPWDVAAGSFLVQQAGGKVTDFNGEENYIFGRELLSSNGLIHPFMLGVIQRHFG